MYAHDCRLPPAQVKVDVRGGVVHLPGLVQSGTTRECFRSLAARIRGVHPVWETLDTPDDPLSVSNDGATIFAGLRPVEPGAAAADLALARYLD